MNQTKENSNDIMLRGDPRKFIPLDKEKTEGGGRRGKKKNSAHKKIT